MKHRQLILIFIVALLAFSPVLLRTNLYGFDPYFFFDSICNGTPLENQPIGAQLLFQFIPCNLFSINYILFVCLFFSCLFAAKLGELFSKDGWLAGIFVFCSPIWLLEFWKFENDIIAFPILFCSAWIFYRGMKNNYLKDKFLAIGLVLLAYTFWEGSLLWLIPFFMVWKWSFIASIPLFILAFLQQKQYFIYFISRIAPSFTVLENLPAFGLLLQAFLLNSLMFVKYVPLMIPPIAFFSLITFINMKFSIHLTYLLSIAATKQFQESKSKVMKYMPIAGIIIVSSFLAFSVVDLPPSPQELSAVEFAVSEAKGQTICNDWSVGHLIQFYGGQPLVKGGGKQECQTCIDCIVLSHREFNCPIINGATKENELKVYRC